MSAQVSHGFVPRDSHEEHPYRYELAWQVASAGVREAAVRFLMRETHLPIADAIKRSHQLLFVVHNRKNEIVAINTATPLLVESLGLKCFYYRTLVGREGRCVGLKSYEIAKQLLIRSYQFFNGRFAAGHDPEVLGLYLEIENPRVMKIRNEAVWETAGIQVVYIGKTLAKGRHCRVCYFDGARIS